VIFKTDNQIKMALGINAWRNLLNDKIIKFAEMMPDMDQDVMMELISQLPQFWIFSRNTLDQLENPDHTISNTLRQNRMHEIKKIISNDLFDDSCTAADRKLFMDTILQNLDQQAELTDKDREYLSGIQRNNNFSTRQVVLASLSFIGSKLNQG